MRLRPRLISCSRRLPIFVLGALQAFLDSPPYTRQAVGAVADRRRRVAQLFEAALLSTRRAVTQSTERMNVPFVE
jgi:hypothetical protein